MREQGSVQLEQRLAEAHPAALPLPPSSGGSALGSAAAGGPRLMVWRKGMIYLPLEAEWQDAQHRLANLFG